MNRKQLIEALLQIGDDDTEVTITDGYRAMCYSGDYHVQTFQYYSGGPITIDIGIGGCEDQ
jgi:hypothetical protein